MKISSILSLVFCVATAVAQVPPRYIDLPNAGAPCWEFPTNAIGKTWRDFLITPSNHYGSWTTGCKQLVISGWARRMTSADVKPVVTWGDRADVRVHAPYFTSTKNDWQFYAFFVSAATSREVNRQTIPFAVTNYEEQVTWSSRTILVDEITNIVEKIEAFAVTNIITHVERHVATTITAELCRSIESYCWNASGAMQSGGTSYGALATEDSRINTAYTGGFISINWDGDSSQESEMEFFGWHILAAGSREKPRTPSDLAPRREYGFEILAMLSDMPTVKEQKAGVDAYNKAMSAALEGSAK